MPMCVQMFLLEAVRQAVIVPLPRNNRTVLHSLHAAGADRTICSKDVHCRITYGDPLRWIIDDPSLSLLL